MTLLESIVILPSRGIQLETQRGIPGWPMSISRTFVSLPALRDVIINEGLSGWNVRYYLALINQQKSGGHSLQVAYEVGATTIHYAITHITAEYASLFPRTFVCLSRRSQVAAFVGYE